VNCKMDPLENEAISGILFTQDFALGHNKDLVKSTCTECKASNMEASEFPICLLSQNFLFERMIYESSSIYARN